MQTIVANEARPPAPQSPIAGRLFDHPNGRMPVDVDDPFALAPLDQHVVAAHGSEECQSLHPVDSHSQSVIAAQIV